MSTVQIGPFSIDSQRDKAILEHFDHEQAKGNNRSATFRSVMKQHFQNTSTLERVSATLEAIQEQLDRVEKMLLQGNFSVMLSSGTENNNDDVLGKLDVLFKE